MEGFTDNIDIDYQIIVRDIGENVQPRNRVHFFIIQVTFLSSSSRATNEWTMNK